MNKKGFVLAETLVVTIFVLLIFTILYNSAVPLLGRYEEISYYDDLDTTYDVYQYKKLLENDTKYSNIVNNNYKVLKCDDFNNILECDKLDDILNKTDEDILLYFNSSYINEITEDNSNNISSEIKDYIKYLNLEDNKKILLLEHDGYISYIELNNLNLVDSEYIKIQAKNKHETCSAYVEEDGITYISGTNDCIDFNYVWYSGKMWRITAIYPDGSMKLVSDSIVDSISFGNAIYYNKTTEEKSNMFIWLNENFKNTLDNYENIMDIDKYWNATITANSYITTKPTENEATMISLSISPVGLLNSYEYYKSFQNTNFENGYLGIDNYWWLLNPYSGNSPPTHVWFAYRYGYGGSGASGINGVRPALIIKSDILLSGSGSFDEPYNLI